jgi:hypothetical protein
MDVETFGARMQKMATNHLCITQVSPASITLQQKNAFDGVTGYLATLAYHDIF